MNLHLAHNLCKLYGGFVQGGITEEQMLKFMGANVNITPLQAKKLLEVIIISVILLSTSILLYISCNIINKCLFQDEAVGFAYVSQREARPSL